MAVGADQFTKITSGGFPLQLIRENAVKKPFLRGLAVLGLFVVLSAPAQAGGFPEALSKSLQQGINACLAHYREGASLSSLQKYGFVVKGKELVIVQKLPGEKSKTKTRVLTEGFGNRECEIHTDYMKKDGFEDAFYLTKTMLAEAGFQALREPKFRPGSKSIFQQGSVSMFMKIDLWDSKRQVKRLMIKFKKR